ncbi:hypothetical protein ACFRNT_15140 [Streptomyces sp. NPDC056697]|uniref:hypothetical protein n=1 Tax=Streptomyces sp. NPDC056697 TaxID=3345915 RepID=UPI00369835E7
MRPAARHAHVVGRGAPAPHRVGGIRYWEYLTHPAHAHTDRIGMPLVEKYDSHDITDDDDPEMGAKIADLHRRRYESDPELAALVSKEQ